MPTALGAERTRLDPAVEREARWGALQTLIRARLVIATLALPVGVLLRTEATDASWWVLWWSVLVVGVVSALFWMIARLRRGLGLQTLLQITTDLVLITALSAVTGGRESPFVLFYALVVLTAGLLYRAGGGLMTAFGACAAFWAVPALSVLAGTAPPATPVWGSPPPHMLFAYLATMGVLAGTLGERERRARHDLEHTTRELDRVRVDNDAILRHLTTGVLTVDGHGTIAYMNPAAEHVLGIETETCCGQHIAKALPERLAPLSDLVEHTLAQGAPRARAELQTRNPAGQTLPLGISTSLLMREGRSSGVVAVFQDLTEVREMERRMRRSETLAEVGALAARIAHELRNGLHPISGSIECLQRELEVEGENAVLMELIGKECNRLNRFVTDLLSYSRERELALENVDLEEQLAECCEWVRKDPRCRPGIDIQYEAQDAEVVISADREQFRQVWLNLAVNALEAMKDHGTLHVRWREAKDKQVVVEFADDGVGIGADDLAQVGQPFFTTKQGGTGLGLAIAQRIVERHGGALWLENAPAGGTVARVWFPNANIRERLVA